MAHLNYGCSWNGSNLSWEVKREKMFSAQTVLKFFLWLPFLQKYGYTV